MCAIIIIITKFLIYLICQDRDKITKLGYFWTRTTITNWGATILCLIYGKCNFNGQVGNWATSDHALRFLRCLCRDLVTLLLATLFTCAIQMMTALLYSESYHQCVVLC